MVAADLDGTLVDSIDQHIKAHYFILNKWGKTFPEPEPVYWTNYFQNTPNANFADYCAHICRDIGLPIDGAAYNDMYSHVAPQLLSHVRYRPGADKAMRLCKDFGATIGIVTSSPREHIALMASSPYVRESEMPFDAYDFFVSAEMVGKTKPHPAPYTYAMRQGWTKPEFTFVIEDSIEGVKSAAGAGVPRDNIAAVYEQNSAHNKNEIKRYCGQYFDDHSQFIAAIEIGK